MKKMTKVGLFKLLLGVFLLGLSSVPVMAAGAASSGNPSNGAVANPLAKNIDGSGHEMTNTDAGWKAYSVVGETGARLVVDESSGAVTDGILHSLCISSGTGFAVPLDTGVVTALTNDQRSAGVALSPPLIATNSPTVPLNCTVLDVQFHNGLAIFNSGTGQTVTALWRKRGGRN